MSVKIRMPAETNVGCCGTRVYLRLSACYGSKMLIILCSIGTNYLHFGSLEQGQMDVPTEKRVLVRLVQLTARPWHCSARARCPPDAAPDAGSCFKRRIKTLWELRNLTFRCHTIPEFRNLLLLLKSAQ